MDSISFEELKVFLEDIEEQLQKLEENLIILEKDSSSENTLNKLFRISHTLKGLSSTAGFKKIANITHHLETIFEGLKNKKIIMDSKVIDILLSTVDTLKALKEDIEKKSESNIDIENIISFLKEIMRDEIKKQNTKEEQDLDFLISEEEEEYLQEEEIKGKHIYRIKLSLKENTEMPSARLIVILEELKDFGKIIKTIPDIKMLSCDMNTNYLNLDILFLGEEEKSKIENILLTFDDIKDIKVLEFYEKISKTKNETQKAEDNFLSDKIDKVKLQDTKIKKTIRVDVERLEALMGITSEILIEKNKLLNLASILSIKYETDKDVKRLVEVKEQFDKKISLLQDEMMKMRLVPLGTSFSKFPRMIRELANKLNKEINFKIFGSDVEIDRTIIEKISDPIIHLLRNAVDHGIKKSGNITLSSWQSEGNVFIEVSDDGDGIHIEKIKEFALKKNIIKETDLKELSQSEILNLIFVPGFSTKDEVSDISGRGVGLDVVKANIEKIQGQIFVETHPGAGTKFKIKIPLTLAIIKALLIALGNITFAIPLSNVYKILKIKKEDIQTVKKKETIILGDNILSLTWLNKSLGINTSKEYNSDKFLKVVVISYFDKKTGLVVDEIIGEQEIVVHSLSKYIGQVPYIYGATIDVDGKVMLILDTQSLVTY